jgi:hypothetical protein
MAETTAPALTVRVWDLVCRHIDGVMVGSTMAALEQRGALKILAGRLDEIIFGGGAPSAVRRLDSFTDLMRREWDLPALPGQLRHQVLTHLDGHLLAPVMVALTRRDALAAGADLVLDRPGLRSAAQILAGPGWVRLAGDRASLTAEGEVAVAMARQYRYPMVYLPLLRRVPALLFGDLPQDAGNGAETHLDRELDISFSGDVFAAVCRTPFLDYCQSGTGDIASCRYAWNASEWFAGWLCKSARPSI